MVYCITSLIIQIINILFLINNIMHCKTFLDKPKTGKYVKGQSGQTMQSSETPVAQKDRPFCEKRGFLDSPIFA